MTLAHNRPLNAKSLWQDTVPTGNDNNRCCWGQSAKIFQQRLYIYITWI